MQIDATKTRLGLFGLGMWLLWSLAIMDHVWAKGEVSFIATRHVRSEADAVSITVGDFNGDGRPDLATANADVRSVVILLGQGDATFQVGHTFREETVARRGRARAASDYAFVGGVLTLVFYGYFRPLLRRDVS